MHTYTLVQNKNDSFKFQLKCDFFCTGFGKTFFLAHSEKRKPVIGYEFNLEFILAYFESEFIGVAFIHISSIMFNIFIIIFVMCSN